MGAIIGGPRRYDGPGLDGARVSQPQVWVCPSCRQKQVSRIEDGCPGCGAGTVEANARAQRDAEATHEMVRPEALAQAIVDTHEDVPPNALNFDLEGLTAKARLTVTHALAYYAAQGAPQPDELAPPVILAWAQHLDSLIPEPEAPVDPDAPTSPTGDPQ